MDQLKLEHLAPYLPYKLMIQTYTHQSEDGKIDVLPMNGLSLDIYRNLKIELIYPDYDIIFSDATALVKPILYPTSKLTQEIEHNGERFIPAKHIPFYEEDVMFNPLNHRHTIVQKLFEWHFDVFDLINKGLAIDKGLEYVDKITGIIKTSFNRDEWTENIPSDVPDLREWIDKYFYRVHTETYRDLKEQRLYTLAELANKYKEAYNLEN